MYAVLQYDIIINIIPRYFEVTFLRFLSAHVWNYRTCSAYRVVNWGIELWSLCNLYSVGVLVHDQ